MVTDENSTILLDEKLDYLPKGISSTSRRDAPTTTIIRIGP